MGPDVTHSLTTSAFADFTFVTLADEDTNSILLLTDRTASKKMS